MATYPALMAMTLKKLTKIMAIKKDQKVHGHYIISVNKINGYQSNFS